MHHHLKVRPGFGRRNLSPFTIQQLGARFRRSDAAPNLSDMSLRCVFDVARDGFGFFGRDAQQQFVIFAATERPILRGIEYSISG